MKKGVHPQKQWISYVTQTGRLMHVMMTKIHPVGKVYHFRAKRQMAESLGQIAKFRRRFGLENPEGNEKWQHRELWFFILCKLVENNWEIGDTLKQGFFFVAFNICSLTAEIFPSLVHIKWCLKLAVDICWWVYSMQVQAEVLCWHFWILLKEILWCWELGLGHTDVYVEGSNF